MRRRLNGFNEDFIFEHPSDFNWFVMTQNRSIYGGFVVGKMICLCWIDVVYYLGFTNSGSQKYATSGLIFGGKDSGRRRSHFRCRGYAVSLKLLKF